MKKIALNLNERFKKENKFLSRKQTTDNASQLSEERDRTSTEQRNLYLLIFRETNNFLSSQNLKMLKRFFGLDLETGEKVIMCTSFIENLILYILSLTMMVKSNRVVSENQYRSILLYIAELENHVKWSKLNSNIQNKLNRKLLLFSFKL